MNKTATLFFLLALSVSSWAQTVIPGVMFVRTKHLLSAAELETHLPFTPTSVVQMLSPLQTLLYTGSVAPHTVLSKSDLMDAEDRLTRTWTVCFSSELNPQKLAQTLLQKHSDVFEVAEPKYVHELHVAPNDPFASQQGAFQVVKMLQAWEITQGNPAVVIGIVDNGVEQMHEDLQGAISYNTSEIPDNMVDDDANGYVDDYAGYNFTWAVDGTNPGDTKNNGAGGHGTLVAGISSAHTNNNLGIAGFGYGCLMIPIKAGPLTGGITHGYDAIVYAVQRGCRVVNNSWGVIRPPSPVEQAVIDFCLASDVLIVASAGNHGSGPSGAGWKKSNYPASYNGVLGVAETTLQDVVSTSSGLGRNAQVAAPGTDAYSTSVGNGYANAGGGTSFASPMVAGVAALIRSHRPNLTALQVAAIIRISGADISSKNAELNDFIPKRLDAHAALMLDPTTTPGVRVLDVERTKSGVVVDRILNGDTITIRYRLQNVLAAVSNLTVDVKIADQGGWDAELLSTSNVVASIGAGGNTWTGEYKLRVKQMGTLPLILKLEYTSGNYIDYSFDYIEPSNEMATMFNNKIMYSIGDNGSMAYNALGSTRKGIGFNWVNRHQLMSFSGVIVSADNIKALKAYENTNYASDFTPTKAFIAPSRNQNIMTDAGVIPSRLVGVEVTQTCTFPSPVSDATVITINVKNTSGTALTNVSVGYLFDVDLGPSGLNNSVRLSPSSIPVGMSGAAAQVYERDDVFVSLVHAAHSSFSGAKAQSAGMLMSTMVDDPDGLTDADVVKLLSSNTAIQTVSKGDVCGVSGIQFPGSLEPGDSRTMIVAISVGANAATAEDEMRATLESPNSVNENTDEPKELTIFPNPSSHNVTLRYEHPIQRVSLIDNNGRIVFDELLSQTAFSMQLNTELFPNGMYTLILYSNNNKIGKPLAILH